MGVRGGGKGFLAGGLVHLVVAALVVLSGPPVPWRSCPHALRGEAALVAYFPFEWSGRETSVLTTLCPLAGTGFPNDLALRSHNLTFVPADWPNAPAGQQAAQFNTSGNGDRAGSLVVGNVQLYGASRKMTAALWTDTAFPVEGVDDQPIMLMSRTTPGGNYQSGNKFNWVWYIRDSVSTFEFVSDLVVTKFASTRPLVGNAWKHLAISLSDSILTFYVNGIAETPFTSDGLLTLGEDYPLLAVGGLPPNVSSSSPTMFSIAGRLDEVYLFDEALDESQIAALMNNTSPLPSEAPLITVPQPVANPSTANTTVLDGFSLTPQIQAADASVPLQYFWAESSSLGCKVASINDPSAPTVEVTLSAITTAAPLSLDLNVRDTFCSPTARTLVAVEGNSPTFGVSFASNYDVYLGENLTINAEPVGFPSPLVFWEEPTLVNATLANGTSIIVTTYKTFASGPSVTFSNPAPTKRDIEERQGSPTFIRTFSCLLRNSIGELRSANITVTGLAVVRPQNETTGDGDGGDVGLIVGLAVGLPLAAILLCLVITTIVLFVILWKYGGRERKIKPPKPDYEALAYGSLLDDNVSLTKDQESNLRKLEDLLLEEDFVLTRAVCETMKATDAEQVAKALTYIYAGHGQAVELLKYFITKEVAASNKEGTLFRANSVSTKIFNCYARMIGIHYVWTIFALPVTELNVMALKAEGHRSDDDGDESTHTTTLLGPVVMEVDPSKMEEAADEQVNTLQLWLIAQKLFVALTRSHGGVPREIKQVLRHVKVEVEQKFSEQAAHKAVGGFLFLRFLCPALMAPQVYGLLKDPPHSTTQRQLILVAKVMQNLANDTLPGKKEGYMERLNDFITSNQQPMRQFYSTLIADADAGSSADLDVPSVVTLNSLVHMHRHISTNLDKLMADLQQDHEDVAEQLREIMDNIGNIDADLP